MSNYPVDFDAVRRDVSLDWFMEMVLGASPRRFAGNIRYSVCPNPECGASDYESNKVQAKDGHWKCFCCGKGGDVIGAAALYFGKSFVEAAAELGHVDLDVVRHYTPPVPAPEIVRDDPSVGAVILKVREASGGLTPAAMQYLASRGINEALATEGYERGVILSIPSDPNEARDWLKEVCGYDLLVQAGLWKVDKKSPAMAYRPLWFVSANQMAFEGRYLRMAKKDEIKVLRCGAVTPWLWGADPDRYFFTEGAIDMLSAVALGTKRTVVGIPGCGQFRPEWFSGYYHKDCMFGFDNDTPGKKAFESHKPQIEALIDASVLSFDFPSPDVKDLNELLIKQLGLKELV